MEFQSDIANYILTPDGVVTIPEEYIVRDKFVPVPVTNEEWRRAREEHVRLCAGTFTAGLPFHSQHIVVVRVDDPFSATGLPLRCMWCLRLAVDGGCEEFEYPFGRNFLWQLPYESCVRMIRDLKAQLAQKTAATPLGSRLFNVFSPTHHEFQRNEWPLCKLQNTIPCYYDKTFVMSVRPTRGSIATKDENRPPVRRIYTRFSGAVRTARRPCPELPDDVLHHAFSQNVHELVRSPLGSDWRHLLALRTCCKSLHRMAEDAASAFLNELLDAVKKAYDSEQVEDMVHARNRVLNAGLVTLSLVCDAKAPGMLNLMRQRHPCGRHPLEKPPRLQKTIEQRMALDLQMQERQRRHNAGKRKRGGEQEPFVVREIAGPLTWEADLWQRRGYGPVRVLSLE
jgi:hypothetical protein